MPVVSLADAKDYLGLTSTASDGRIQRLIDSVQLMVERHTGLVLEPNPAFDSGGADTNPPVTITLPVSRNGLRPWPSYVGAARGLRTWVREETASVLLPYARQITAVTMNSPAATLTLDAPGVTSSDVYWVDSDYRLLPAVYGRRLSVFSGAGPVAWVQVTGKFGIVPAPADILDVILALTARRYHEKDASWSDAVALQDGAVVNYFRQFPASVKATLDSYSEIGV